MLLLALWCAGCAGFYSREAAAGCQVADAASTVYALHHNPAAAEQNTAVSVNWLIAIKLALAAWIMSTPREEWEAASPFVRGFVTVVGCGPALNNLYVARQKP